MVQTLMPNGKMFDKTRHERFLPTLDDWYPNFERHLIRVSFSQLYPCMLWRVSVWGNDDCGMERDFESRTLAEHTFVSMINRPYINKDDLLINGFVRS